MCEGANFADLDKDGNNDIVAGPYWWAGPRFDKQHEFYEPKVKAFDPAHYSDAFFVWPYDVDGDGWTDLVTVGFPGQEAYWYRNPLADKSKVDAKWTRSLIHANVSNEAPAFADLKHDGKRELVFNTDKNFVWAEPDPKNPSAPWIVHKFSEDIEGLGAFVHGLGVGDVDGDGKPDVLWHNGWFRQPSSLAGDPLWKFEAYAFGDKYGGAQMHVMDVDGDGLPDVITSLAAHHFGLSWFQQTRTYGAISFVEHRFMDDTPEKGVDGVCFGEVHAVDIADVNGDGLPDIVTGKRWWSHGAVGDPQPGSKPEVWWFELVRDKTGAHYVPHLADDESGVGTGVIAGDVDKDKRCDIVIGNKRGVFVLLQRDASVVAAKKLAAAEAAKQREAELAAMPPTFDFESGDLRGWHKTGTAFDGQPIEGDTSSARGHETSLHAGKFWIGGYEKLGDAAEGTLTSNPFTVEQPWASFLVGGGGGSATRVDIRAADGALFYRSSGANFESMQRVVVDMRPQLGKKVTLKLVDEATGGWGHINFDDFRFHAEKPSFETPPGVPRILPLDEVPNAGMPAKDAPAAMSVPQGFHVDLIASEPDVHQPIAFAIDDRGRLWVAEGLTYPRRMEGDEGKDDIVVFEDKDGDGTFETRTVFLDKLNLVSGLEVGFGGVWIGAAPYLLFVPDKDGDLKPDGPAEKVLDGFGWQDTHETLNAFNWGPDGWLYGTHGVFTHSHVGKPGTPDDKRVTLTAGVWRFQPKTREFEVFSEGTSNPWGVDFDAHGQAVITACVIPHLFHMIQGGRYDRQDGIGGHTEPYTFDDIKTIADHLHWQGADPWNGNNRSGATGGGHAHCGCLVYLGDQFPAEYRGNVLMNNIHGNRTNMDILVPEGSGFVGKHGPDLLLANDKWFRGTSLRMGPDGSVFVTDWYDKQACHETHPEIWDRTNGRIYRISYGTPKRGVEKIADATTEELVHAAIDGDEWHSRHARRLLQERGAKVPYFNAGPGATPQSRLRSLWTSHVSGWPTEDALGDSDEYVVAWSIQLMLEKKQVGSATLTKLETLATTTKSPVVRLYLASGLQRLPLEQRWKIAESLIAHEEDAKDHNLPFMYWYGIEALVESDTARALGLVSKTKIDPVRRFLVRRAGAQAKLHDALVTFLARPENLPEMPWMLEEFRAGIGDQRKLPAPAGWEQLAARLCEDAKLVDPVESLSLVFGDKRAFPKLRARLADPKAEAGLRREALEALLAGHDPELKPVLSPLLADASLQRDVIRAYASFDGEDVANELLAKYDSFDQQAKRDALNTLASRKTFATRLLDSVGSGAIPRNDLSAFTVQSIENLGDAALAAKLHEVWGNVRQSNADVARKQAEWKARLTPDALAKADLPRGREVFSRTCEQCHTLFGSGAKIGPELTGSNRADLDYLLSNVLDPSAIVGKDYTTTLVWLNDARMVNGILKATTDSTISLQTDTALVVVEKSDIETQKDSTNSLMPEGQLETLKEDEVRDLVAYLQSPQQVTLRATKLCASRLFDGKSLAGWKGDGASWSVEQGEIVGRTKGLAKNEFLVSELLLSDFRLELDVRLVKDEGNSGVQFRTTPRADGEVVGLQADVGPGWWGKLYEENGRGLVVDKEQTIEKDGWNHYSIEARGAHVKVTLDGNVCADLDDPKAAREGILALQLHSGGPTEVRFRNLKLEVLE